MNKKYLLCKYNNKKMLSVIIPSYNYFTFPLVKQLHEQASAENIDFEILVLDDASNNLEIRSQNEAINLLLNCQFLINDSNLGRGKTINKLVLLAQYNLLILLDCDTKPKDTYFIKKYIDFKNKTNSKITFGGILYSEKKPLPKEMLRWVYGKKRESFTVSSRKKNPYKTTLTSNILVDKKLMLLHPFPNEITEYGFEDLVLIIELEKNKIKINHIENPIYHLKLDTSIDFITKFHSSLKNLKKIYDCKIIHYKDTEITRVYFWINRFKLEIFFTFLFYVFKNLLIKNLVSNSPSIFIFDLYRLGYFCKINSK